MIPDFTPLNLNPAARPVPAFDRLLLESTRRPRLTLLWGTRAPARALLVLLTMAAAQGHTPRLFDGYFVARLARRLGADPHALLERTQLSRAITCFQLAELIENAPADPEPLFVLDLLATFCDESGALRESERLLARTIAHLKRLAAAGPVIVGAREPGPLVQTRWPLLDRLQTAADTRWLLRAPER